MSRTAYVVPGTPHVIKNLPRITCTIRLVLKTSVPTALHGVVRTTRMYRRPSWMVCSVPGVGSKWVDGWYFKTY